MKSTILALFIMLVAPAIQATDSCDYILDTKSYDEREHLVKGITEGMMLMTRLTKTENDDTQLRSLLQMRSVNDVFDEVMRACNAERDASFIKVVEHVVTGKVDGKY